MFSITSTFAIYFFVLLTSAAIGLFSIPSIIYIAKKKNLFDNPDNNRKLHLNKVSNLGGVAIFCSYIITVFIFLRVSPQETEKFNFYNEWNYIVAASFILFLTGLKDDLVNISPNKKFVAQLFAAFLVVFIADIRLGSLHELFGVSYLPYWVSIIFSILGCIFITNAINLIDGVDGLAGCIACLSLGLFGVLFSISEHTNLAIICFALMGAIIGFLKYNLAPAKIFMGDTGSLLIGFMLSIIAILFVKIYANDLNPTARTIIHSPGSAVIFALAILFIPIFDTFRVFSLRIIKGKSPFSADRTHLHHYLLDCNLTHSQTTLVVLLFNIFLVSIAYFVQDMHPFLAFSIFLTLLIICNLFLLEIKKTRIFSLSNNPVQAIENKIPPLILPIIEENIYLPKAKETKSKEKKLAEL